MSKGSNSLNRVELRLRTLYNSALSSHDVFLASELEQILEELSAARPQLNQDSNAVNPGDSQSIVARVLDTLPDGYVITARSGEIVHANAAAAGLFKRTAASLVGKSITELVPDHERKAFKATLSHINAAQPTHEWEISLRRARQAPFPAHLQVTWVDEPTEQLHWLVRDLTALKQAEKARERSEFLSYAGQLLGATPDFATRVERVTRVAVPAFADLCVVRVCDEQGRTIKIQVAHTDPAKELELAELETRFWLDKPHTNPMEQLQTSDKRKFAMRVTDDLLNDIAYADEHLSVLRGLGLKSYIAVPLKIHGRTFGALAFATAQSGRTYDQDDLLLAEAFARRAAFALENAQRYDQAQRALAERDRALGQALQQVRIPLNVMVNLSQVMKTHLQHSPLAFGAQGGISEVIGTSDLLQHHLEDVGRAGERLRAMIHDITELASMQNQSLKLYPRWVDLGELVNAVVESVRLQQEDGRAPRDVRIRVSVPETEQITAMVDEERIAQVLTNLLDNSLKYSPRGGSVDLRLELIEDATHAPQAHLVVGDRGIGVPPEEQARIFEPYVRASNTLDQNIAGIGVGLALAAEIIARHEGHIWVESEGVNRGSTFHMLLPNVQVE